MNVSYQRSNCLYCIGQVKDSYSLLPLESRGKCSMLSKATFKNKDFLTERIKTAHTIDDWTNDE